MATETEFLPISRAAIKIAANELSARIRSLRSDAQDHRRQGDDWLAESKEQRATFLESAHHEFTRALIGDAPRTGVWK